MLLLTSFVSSNPKTDEPYDAKAQKMDQLNTWEKRLHLITVKAQFQQLFRKFEIQSFHSNIMLMG